MNPTQRQNQNAAKNGSRVYTTGTPVLTRHTKLTPLGEAFRESVVFCRGHQEGRSGADAKRDSDGNIYCVQCVARAAA